MKTISAQFDIAVLTSDQPGRIVEDCKQTLLLKERNPLNHVWCDYGHVARLARSDDLFDGDA